MPEKKRADLVIYSTNIYTIKDEEKLDGAIAVKDNIIMKVGQRSEVEALVGPETKVYDVDKQMVMPGFVEGHTHIDGPLFKTSRVDLIGVESEEECARLTKEWADANTETDWVFGFGWHASNWGRQDYPSKESLDKLIPDRPVFLQDIGCHAGWMNSKALEVIGIGKEPVDLLEKFGYTGKVFRDENGEPTGVCQDGPVLYLTDLSNQYIEEDMESNLERALDLYLEKGVTSINEMWMHNDKSPYIISLQKLLEQGRLKSRVFFQYSLIDNDVSQVVEAKKRFNTDKLKLIGIKAIGDSSWADRSAAVLREYKNDPGNFGQLYIDNEVWADKIAEANKHGISAHLHCSGNRCARVALDLYEEVQKRNGPGDYRNSIEHLDTIHPDDVPRFQELDVMANITPDFMYKTNAWKDSPALTAYDDETLKWCWPFNTLLETGAMVSYGCDSPASTMDPLVQIFRAANRVMEDGEPKGGFIPSEKISAKKALKCYTYNGAYEARMEDKIGTLEEGKYADIIILDQNIVEIDPLKIRDASVVVTIADGKVVYEK